MAANMKAIPDGYYSLTPYLTIDGATEAIEFYKKAFGAKELLRMPAPGGKVGHAELQIGNSRVMLADETPEMGTRGPKTIGGTASGLVLYVEDVDRVYDLAVKEGAKVLNPVKDQFYGDRMGSLEDPFGHRWYVGTHIEDVSPEEMEKRSKEAMAAGASA
jgi:PhnB protein